MLPSELHYNRYGLRYVSSTELAARKQFVLSHDFSEGKWKFHKPLNSYQNKKQTLSLSELVKARHEDEMKHLDKKYQDFFYFSESREYKSYLYQKREMEKDYENQKKWLLLYKTNNANSALAKRLSVLQATTGALFLGVGTMSALSNSPFAPTAASLFYIGSCVQFFTAYKNLQALKKENHNKEHIRLILEDWYEQDPFARYDRAILNDSLNKLSKTKPSATRRDRKYRLVQLYRAKHPKTKI